MTKIKNIFLKGIIDRDSDERLVNPEVLIDAENFLVTTSNGSNGGVGKNVPSNTKKSNYNLIGAETIGSGKNQSKNKIYNFVKSNDYDYIIEYDVVANTSSIVLQYVSGGILNFNNRILNVDVISTGEEDGDFLAWSGDSNPPRIVNIERAKLFSINGFTEEEISVIKSPPIYPPTLNPIISTENSQSNFLEDKFVSFSYRYKYKDGYYSALSTWTEYFFVPGLYNIDFDTFENLGMKNIYNAVNVTLFTGSREVIGIDLIFKLSLSSTPYIVDKFLKEDEGWLDNTNITIEFNNSKVYGVLPESEFFRSYDNVPLQSYAQTLIGNRIAYGNYLEQRDLIDINGDKVVPLFELDLIAKNISQKNLTSIKLDITYSYETPSVLVNDAVSIIDFSGVSFEEGSSINFSFNLKTIGINPVKQFTDVFIYILPATYTSLNDFITNSTFLDSLNNYTDFFQSNGGVVFPPNYVPNYVLNKGFGAFVVSNFLYINYPVISYEIDNSPNPNDFVFDYFYDFLSSFTFNRVGVATSLKSNRSYEVCQIYRDEYARKTTALTSTKNTLFIPNENSITQNQIQVTIPINQLPPKWAKTYKFGIKVNTNTYETIPINIFFVDGIYRWLKIDGENKNKIKEGQILLVKKDGNGPLSDIVKVKVLELKQQEKNFLSDNTQTEPEGLYAKIKVSNFEMQYADNEFIHYERGSGKVNGRPTTVIGDFSELNDDNQPIDRQFVQGSTINLFFSSNYHAEAPFVQYSRTFTAQRNYDNFEDFFNAQILPIGFTSTNYPQYAYEVQLIRGDLTFTNIGGNINYDVTPNVNGRLYLKVTGIFGGSNIAAGKDRRGFVVAVADIRFISGLYIFESLPIDANNSFFIETPEVYNIVNGNHQQSVHVLTKTFNCFCQGNGIESFQIRDAFNEKSLAIDFTPIGVSEDEYKEVRRFADITYSGILTPNTNVNKLNEFNLSLANYKDDIEKSFGPIIKIKGQDTNLDVYQEDKISVVYYGKDLLYNADGTTNLSRIEDVLGQQKTDGGEYGISNHPESFDDFAFNTYFTDVKRGVVLKKNYANGLFEISSQFMRSYFKNLFRNNTINNIIGEYDQYNDYFILNIKYNDGDFVTWVYSDKDNGWLGRLNFNPEDMIRINNELISFKNGEVYLHNQEETRNTFYGIESPSKFSFNFSQDPSTRKSFKNLEIEGSTSVKANLKTDLSNGYVNSADFERKEGTWYAYVRNSNNVIDTALLSVQGIGNCTISGLNLNFDFELDSLISVGDEVRNSNLELVGIITSKTSNSLILNSVNNINTGDYVLCSKSQSIQNGDLLGYYMRVDCEFSGTEYKEIFAINSTVTKSYS